MDIAAWAIRWGIPQQAIQELMWGLRVSSPPSQAEPGTSEQGSESRQDSLLAMEADRKGVILWRNNVGALLDKRGVPVRYGLANESKKINERMKSSDRIGIKPVLITQPMVGRVIGQFVAREVKEAGWRYTGKGREEAQYNFIRLVISYGGDAGFCTGEGTL